MAAFGGSAHFEKLYGTLGRDISRAHWISRKDFDQSAVERAIAALGGSPNFETRHSGILGTDFMATSSKPKSGLARRRSKLQKRSKKTPNG